MIKLLNTTLPISLLIETNIIVAGHHGAGSAYESLGSMFTGQYQ